MSLVTHIFKGGLIALVALALIASLAVVPGFAQEDAPGGDHESELRTWWEGLPDHRKRELLHRRRALKRLPLEQRRELVQRAREGRPVLTEIQRERLERLRAMPPVKRLRLYTLAAELTALRRANPRGLQDAMGKTGRERAQALRGLLARHRMMLFMRSLPRDEQRRVREMRPPERMRYWAEKKKEVMETLVGYHPRVRELGQMARRGDEQARREFREMSGDLLTLSLLIQRLSPDLQRKTLDEIRNLSIEKSADVVRRALHDQWKNETRRDHRRNRQRNHARPGD